MSETFECSHCRTTLLTELDLRNHERLHKRHPPTTPPTQLWKASPKVVKVNQTSIRCQMCTDRFTSPKDLQRHCRQKHPDHERSDIFSCHFCPAVLFHESDLATHERLHQVPVDQFSTAPPSDQVSKFVAPKTQKKRSVEKGPFICAYCGKMLTTRSSFVIHERTHTGEIPERPFVCETCGKGFTSKCNMLLHSRVHSQETPFSCETCLLTFRTRRELVVHIRSHKEGDVFKCQYCEETFHNKNLTLEHERIHDGELMGVFECDICHKAFSAKHTLNYHMSTHINSEVHQQ